MSRFGFVKKWRQRGATAIEFAFVFPILFGITYASIVYGFVFYLQQTLNFTAEETARVAVASTPPGGAGGGGSCAALSLAATTQFALFKSQYSAQNPIQLASLSPPVCPGSGSPPTFTVSILLPTSSLSGPGGFLAQVTLPLIGVFPPLPTTLSGTSVIGVN